MKLWRLKSSTVCKLDIQKGQGYKIQPKLKGLRTIWANGIGYVQRAGENEMKCLCWKGEAGEKRKVGIPPSLSDILDDYPPILGRTYWVHWFKC